MATDPYLSKQSVGGLVERCVNTPPSRTPISVDPFSTETISNLLPIYWNTFRTARVGDEFIIEMTKTTGTTQLITMKCFMVNSSAVDSIHFFCKVPKLSGNWNPTSLNFALDTATQFNTYELVISPTDSSKFIINPIQ